MRLQQAWGIRCKTGIMVQGGDQGYAFAQQPRAVSGRSGGDKYRDPAGMVDDRLAVRDSKDSALLLHRICQALMVLALCAGKHYVGPEGGQGKYICCAGSAGGESALVR